MIFLNISGFFSRSNPSFTSSFRVHWNFKLCQMPNGEEFWFLVKFIFQCQYRDINPAFVIDNNSAKINQEAKGNRLYLLHYLTICLWIYFQVIIQTCLVLIIKWFNISTFFLFFFASPSINSCWYSQNTN